MAAARLPADAGYSLCGAVVRPGGGARGHLRGDQSSLEGPGAVNTSPAAPGSVRRQRRVLIGLALLFFAPLGLAFFLYYGVGWRPGGRVNNGELIDPPRPLPAAALPRVDPDGTAPDRLTAPDFLTRKWTLLYWG